MYTYANIYVLYIIHKYVVYTNIYKYIHKTLYIYILYIYIVANYLKSIRCISLIKGTCRGDIYRGVEIFCSRASFSYKLIWITGNIYLSKPPGSLEQEIWSPEFLNSMNIAKPILVI